MRQNNKDYQLFFCKKKTISVYLEMALLIGYTITKLGRGSIFQLV